MRIVDVSLAMDEEQKLPPAYLYSSGNNERCNKKQPLPFGVAAVSVFKPNSDYSGLIAVIIAATALVFGLRFRLVNSQFATINHLVIQRFNRCIGR